MEFWSGAGIEITPIRKWLSVETQTPILAESARELTVGIDRLLKPHQFIPLKTPFRCAEPPVFTNFKPWTLLSADQIVQHMNVLSRHIALGQ